jgi:Uma2 family endonuclease
MNLQSRYPTTPDEFLRWNEGREGKREFVRGRVVEMMIQVTRNHARVAFNLEMALGRRLNLDSMDIGSADFGVLTPDGVRYPDVYVDQRSQDSYGSDLAATNAVFIAEILSPSSYGRDFVEKLSDYKGLSTLRHYLILSQDEPRVRLWSRGEDGGWNGPDEIFGEEGQVELTRLAATIPLSELYVGILARRPN